MPRATAPASTPRATHVSSFRQIVVDGIKKAGSVTNLDDAATWSPADFGIVGAPVRPLASLGAVSSAPGSKDILLEVWGSKNRDIKVFFVRVFLACLRALSAPSPARRSQLLALAADTATTLHLLLSFAEQLIIGDNNDDGSCSATEEEDEDEELLSEREWEVTVTSRLVALALVRGGALELWSRALQERGGLLLLPKLKAGAHEQEQEQQAAAGGTSADGEDASPLLCKAMLLLIHHMFECASACERLLKACKQNDAEVEDSSASASLATQLASEGVPLSPDGRGRHAALAVELLAAVRRSGVLEHMSRAVLQLAADEWERRRNADKQRGPGAAAGPSQPQQRRSPERAAAAPAGAGKLVPLLPDGMSLQDARNAWPNLIADWWLLFLQDHRMHALTVYGAGAFRVTGHPDERRCLAEALATAEGPATQYLLAAHATAQVAAAEVAAAAVTAPGFTAAPAAPAAAPATAAFPLTHTPPPPPPHQDQQHQQLLYGLTRELLPWPLLEEVEESEDEEAEDDVRGDGGGGRGRGGGSVRGLAGGYVALAAGCVHVALHAWWWQLQQSTYDTGGGAPEGQQQSQPQVPPPQLLSNRARAVLALRAARAALQRWHGYLELQQLLPQPVMPGGNGISNSAAAAADAAIGPGAAGEGAPSPGAAAPPPKPAKPLTQKQLRQRAATAAKQQQAAAAKQAAAAAAAAEQRREERKREAAAAIAAARRVQALRAYRQGGWQQAACGPVAMCGLSYCHDVHFDRLCRAALREPERTAAAVAAALSAEQTAYERSRAAATAAGAESSGSGSGSSSGSGSGSGSSIGVVMSEEWWRLALQCVQLLAADARRLLWSPERSIAAAEAAAPFLMEDGGGQRRNDQGRRLQGCGDTERFLGAAVLAGAGAGAGAGGGDDRCPLRVKDLTAAGAVPAVLPAAEELEQGPQPQGPQPQGPQPQQPPGRHVAAAALTAAKRAGLYRGLSLGLLPALEALLRAAARTQPHTDVVVARGLTPQPPPVFGVLRCLLDWRGMEHVLLEAAPPRQAAAYMVTASKASISIVGAVCKEERLQGGVGTGAGVGGAAAAAVQQQLALLALDAVGAQTPPIEVVDSLLREAGGSSGSSSSNSEGSSGSNQEQAPQQQPQQQQQQQAGRVELVSLLLATRLSTASSSASAAFKQWSHDRCETEEAAQRSMDIASSLLEWVPALVLAHTLALERGDARAAGEWKAFVVVELNIDVMLMCCCYDYFDVDTLGKRRERLVMSGALCVAAAFPDVMQGSVGRQLRDILRGRLSKPSCERLEGVWEEGEAGAAARVEVLEGLRSAAGAARGREPQAAEAAWATPPAEAVALLLTPAEVRRRLGLCAWGGCAEFLGDSEAGVQLRAVCRGCRQPRYCSERCASEHRAAYSFRGFTAC